MEHILGGDGFGADPALSESHIRRHLGIQIVADHDHVEQFRHGVDPVGQRRVRGAGQHIEFARHLDDVGGVTATGAFRVVGVDRATFKRRDGIFDKAALVEGIGVDTHLHIHVVGDRETGPDGGGRRAPIFVNFEACGAGQDLFDQGRFA